MMRVVIPADLYAVVIDVLGGLPYKSVSRLMTALDQQHQDIQDPPMPDFSKAEEKTAPEVLPVASEKKPIHVNGAAAR